MMNFLFIEEILPNLQIDLRVLSRGTERYRMLLYQHEGVLGLTEHGSKLGNMVDNTAKFRSFLNLACSEHPDLVMTPEYSCPWANIKEILDDPEKWPAAGKLWALGSESITPEQINDFATHYDSDQIIFHYDAGIFGGNGVFLDPLVYLFRTTQNNVAKLIVLVQFKTQHMGVRAGGDLERDRLIEGRHIYIIRNNSDSVNLMTVICSEAMNFPAAMGTQQKLDVGWNDRPFLVLNPQVNPDPTHEDFIAFRKFVAEQERKEIIGLNWNLNSKIGAHALLRNGTSRSGVYMTSHDIKFEDQQRVRKNHRLGMYYFYFGKHKHAFLLNSKPHAFLIDNLSVHITEGVMAQRMRNGPEVMTVYEFQPDWTLASTTAVSDDHLICLNDLGCHNTFLNDPENCVLEKERLVCLSAGEFLPNSFESWSGLDKLFSIRLLEGTEINKRITFAEDTVADSQRQRQLYVDAVNVLDGEILPDKGRYPASLADLRAYPVFLAYAQETDVNSVKLIQREKFRYNIVNQHGNMVNATICYLGLSTLRKATEAFEFIQSMFEIDSMNRQRVVVFYKEGLKPAVVADGYAGRIVISEEKGPSSYLN